MLTALKLHETNTDCHTFRDTWCRCIRSTFRMRASEKYAFFSRKPHEAPIGYADGHRTAIDGEQELSICHLVGKSQLHLEVRVWPAQAPPEVTPRYSQSTAWHYAAITKANLSIIASSLVIRYIAVYRQSLISVMDSLTPAVLEQILESVNGLLATKYLAVVAWICVVWDHVLTFHQEVDYIWRERKFSLTKYGLPFALDILLETDMVDRQSSPVLHLGWTLWCKRFSATLCLFIIIYPTIANSYMSSRLYMLWDQRKKTVIILGAAFLITYIPVVVFSLFTLVLVYNHTVYAPEPLNTCIIYKRSVYVIGVFGAMCTFDLFIILFSFLNALDRPFRHYTEALAHFRRDGAIFFSCMFLLRLTNMIIFISVPVLDEFTGVFFAWSMVSITLSRLILRVEGMKKPRYAVSTWVPATNSYEMGRWSSGPVE
ncbi:hypothetical protein NM688_g4229 [Phlebia brevispora]|uniref:Uncharacterized protein n=1 Tax=Phlebia brevispora TaxID=194682 RepID=A0ACC1T3Q1_9APHY|nr:hypothetical protein NM688_g4229 [Phlebia brevispora]